MRKKIAQLREGVDEKFIKSKFKNNSKILDEILNSQRSSSDRSGLGFVKERKEAREFPTH